MQPLKLLKCLGKALVRHAGNAVGFGLAGDVVVGVGEEAWNEWNRAKNEQECVSPDLCDNLGNAAIQHAFNEFHNNLHVATASSIGPAAPGLHNGHGGEIVARACSFVP